MERSPNPAGAVCTTSGQSRWRAGEIRAARRSRHGTSGSPATTRCRPAALAGRGRRARCRGARGRSRLPGGSALDCARPRRRVARAWRARGVARPPRAGQRRRSTVRWRCWPNAIRSSRRAVTSAVRARTTGRSASRGPCWRVRGARSSCSTAVSVGAWRIGGGGEERSEAVAALAWAEAVAGDIDEAERLLIELSHLAPADEALRRYDAGHARALALMRRGRFVESYGPSIAAGEAIARAGRPDLAYGCWANAASAAAAAGEHDRALEFLDRGIDAVAGHGLHSIELHLLSQRSFVLRGLGRLEEARRAAGAEQAIAERLAQPELRAMASNDLGLVSLEAGEWSDRREPARRLARGLGCADQSPADATRARRGARARRRPGRSRGAGARDRARADQAQRLP